MADTISLVPNTGQALVATPNEDTLPRVFADFATFGEAMDYAAKGKRGFNFHDPRGTLTRVYPFSELREDALKVAYALIARGVKKDDRIALIAETGPDFAALFCGAVYAGAWPVPLPLPTSFGGKDNYIEQLGVQLASSPCPRRTRTTSAICSIPAARPASRTASRSRTVRCCRTWRATATAWSSSRATAASRGCLGTTTWAWSAASCR
jgi:acyl-CoA synthetase (AMP-forming)/AMP-acid ligase II